MNSPLDPNGPTVALTPRLRFVLYLLTAVGGAVVAYATAKGWIGDAEVALWVALAAIPNVIAASNVPRAGRRRRQP